jgi:septal ring factor EnvC (AmiA/AmiB activator)
MRAPALRNPLLQAVIVISAIALFFGSAHPEGAKDRYKHIQEKIKQHKRRLTKVREVEGLTLEELDRTNRQLNAVEKDLRRYTRRLRETEGKVRKVEADISALQKKLDRRRQWMKRRLRYMYKYGGAEDAIVVLGTSESFSQFLRRWRYMEVLASYERKVVEEYKGDLVDFRRKQEELEGLRARLKKERDRVEKTMEALELRKRQKAVMLASVRKEKAANEKMLRDLKAASADLLKIIRESERKRYIGKGFRGLKGSLPWPVQGRVAIPYGTQKDLRFNTPIFRNGIYIEAPEGSVARAVHGGRVVFAEWFKGYGDLVIVNHGGGYHSLYANLSEIFLKAGDIIDTNTEVGRVGDSSTFNKSALYFEIRYKGKPLDPAQWLKRR